MKFKFFGFALGALLTVSAAGQAGKMLTLTVPFPFHVGATTLPAEQYALYRADHPYDLWRIQKTSGERTAIFTVPHRAVAKSDPPKSRLVFHAYGSSYFLSQVWIEGQEVGWELTPSKLERDMLAQSMPRIETVLAEARPR